MNNKTMTDLAYAAIFLSLAPFTFRSLFEHKSHRDYRVNTSMN